MIFVLLNIPNQSSAVIISVDKWQLLKDLQESAVEAYLFDDEGKYLDCARTLFIWLLKLWQLPFPWKSCIAASTPSTIHSQYPIFFLWDVAFLPVMHYQWDCRHFLGLPNYLPLSFSVLTPPLSTVAVYLPRPPRSLASTPLHFSFFLFLAIHSFICLGSSCFQLSLSKSPFSW